MKGSASGSAISASASALTARARQILRLASAGLSGLFWGAAVLLGAAGGSLALVASAVHPLAGLGVLAATGGLVFLLHGKKETVGGLLGTAETVVGKSGAKARERAADVVKAVVEEALSTAAMSAAVAPGALAGAAVLLGVLKFKAAAWFFGIAAGGVAGVAGCAFWGVRHVVLREIDHVVGGLEREGKGTEGKGGDEATERTPLVGR